MITTKRIIVRRKREDVLIVRKSGQSIQCWCTECWREVPMVSPEEAALTRRVGTRLIYRLVEARDVHFIESRRHAAYLSDLAYG